jgi:predicted secreted hydrolase
MRAICCRLLCLLVALGLMCSAYAAGAPVSDLDIIRGKEANDGFALANVPRTFAFPRDHGPHPAFRHEWWYVTGNLDSDTGERFGFELTIFRVGLAPGAVAAAGVAGAAGSGAVSAWHTLQVYAAHFAVTDVARGTFEFAEKYSRDALGLAGAQAQPVRVWLDDWVLGSAAPNGAPGDPTQVVVSRDSQPGQPWTLHARGHRYELTLDAQFLGQPVLNGDHGLSRKSAEPAAASYYYSIPRVAVHGKVVRDGVPCVVKGLAWLDREWGSGSLGAKERGWDWFAFQLEDGSSLMFYALRNHDGTRDPHSAGTWVDPAGHAQPLSTDQVTIDVSDHWVSPRGGRYPSRWRVRVPAVGLDVEVRPALANQELGTNPRYWEGAVDLHGVREGQGATGRGYVELVGYGE